MSFLEYYLHRINKLFPIQIFPRTQHHPSSIEQHIIILNLWHWLTIYNLKKKIATEEKKKMF